MDINLLSKLAELKQYEVDECKNDLETLNNIVANFDMQLTDQKEMIDAFINECLTVNHNAEQMMNGRIYLKQLDAKHKEINEARLEAIDQKNAAFESLKSSVVELKKFTKLIEKMETRASIELSKKAFVIDDEVELYRYNNKV